MIADSFKSLLIRLYDYRFNGNPTTRTSAFDQEWINDVLTFLIDKGYSVLHIKGYNPFNLDKSQIKFIKAPRKPYKISTFRKAVKHLKYYILLMKKYQIIPNIVDTDFIDSKDFITRRTNKSQY